MNNGISNCTTQKKQYELGTKYKEQSSCSLTFGSDTFLSLCFIRGGVHGSSVVRIAITLFFSRNSLSEWIGVIFQCSQEMDGFEFAAWNLNGIFHGSFKQRWISLMGPWS
jgi:hypothetical protein